MTFSAPKPLTSFKSGALSGVARVPGDKSISHRALMFGALASGETIISGLLEGEDVMNTADALRAMGARITTSGDGLWRIFGVGGNFLEPTTILDMGNSGTSTRLLMGLIAGSSLTAILTGDASLLKRPMARVVTPLEKMGVTFMGRHGGKLPLALCGADDLKAINYTLPVASAQVKSAILLAGLSARGTTTVIEPEKTRDHTENMIRHFGGVCTISGHEISVQGGQSLQGCAVDVPSDPSSAAFIAVAATLIPGSNVTIARVCMNPTRTGLYKTLLEMGAAITYTNERIEAGEPVADLIITGGAPLKGVDVPQERVASMIDEFPILSIAASCAQGTSHFSGLKELRVKESDRLAKIAEGLNACGVSIELGEDWLTIQGTGRPPEGGAFIETALDHRIAMSFLIMGLVSNQPVTIDDRAPIATSFPNFIDLMQSIGAKLDTPDGDGLIDFRTA